MEEEIKKVEITGKPKKKLWKQVLNFASYFVIVFVILFGLPRFLSWKLQTPYPMAAITSGSMWPVLKKGDLVFIHGVKDKSQLALGDIIVFKNRISNNLTIHRIIKMDEQTLTTKGDANFDPDAPVAYSDVIGKTLSFSGGPLHIPYIGSVTVFANSFKQQNAQATN